MRIMAINEVKDEKLNIQDHIFANKGGDLYNGYIIDLKMFTRGVFKFMFLIQNHQDCCEEHGYLCTNDNIQDFIDAEVRDIKFTDGDLETRSSLDELLLQNNSDDRGVNTIFITLETSKGVLQFVAYNAHNGYYGHIVYTRMYHEIRAVMI